jgi:hypothetical protein
MTKNPACGHENPANFSPNILRIRPRIWRIFAVLAPTPAPTCRILREFSPVEPGYPVSRIPGRSPYSCVLNSSLCPALSALLHSCIPIFPTSCTACILCDSSVLGCPCTACNYCTAHLTMLVPGPMHLRLDITDTLSLVPAVADARDQHLEKSALRLDYICIYMKA